METKRDIRADLREWTGRNLAAGVFADYAAAERAIEDLRRAGFKDSQIGMAVRDDLLKREGQQTGAKAEGWLERIKDKFQHDQQHRTYTDVRGTLDEMGVPGSLATRFESRVRNGGVLVTAHCGGRDCGEALSILERDGADIGTGAASAAQVPPPGKTGEHRIQLMGEILRSYTERVARGEVAVRKEVVTETQKVQVPVSHEEVIIEHRPLSSQPERAEIREGEEIRVPVTEEQVRVQKQPVVTGEVAVRKERIQDNKEVSDEVRHEELRVDRKGDVNIQDKRDKTRKTA